MASSARRHASVSTPSRPPHRTKSSRPVRLLIGRERSVTKYRMKEERHCRHGNHDPVGVAGLLEPADYAIAVSGRGIDRNQIVVVQVHAPGAHFRQFQWAKSSVGRASPNASRPELPTVQSPKENLSSARGW